GLAILDRQILQHFLDVISAALQHHHVESYVDLLQGDGIAIALIARGEIHVRLPLHARVILAPPLLPGRNLALDVPAPREAGEDLECRARNSRLGVLDTLDE